MSIDQMPSYPIAIQKAVTAVHCLDFFKKFTCTTKSVLMEIIIRVDQFDSKKPIWFKRNNVAAKLQCDRKTIYNALKKLEDNGLIQRHEQEVDSMGYFTCAKIVITETLADIIALPWNISHRGEKRELPNTINCYYNNLKKQPEQNSFVNHKKAPKLFEDPALKLLENLGLTNPAIFSLMKICKSFSQRLSDVVNYIGNRLKKIKSPREVFAYLRKCITANKDYSFMLERKTGEQEKNIKETEKRQTLKKNMDIFFQQHAKKKFQSLKTNNLYSIQSDRWAYNEMQGTFLAPYEFYQAVIAGRLKILNITPQSDKVDARDAFELFKSCTEKFMHA